MTELQMSYQQMHWGFEFNISAKPESPTDLHATEKSWESVFLQWNPGFDGGYTQNFMVLLQSIHGNKTVDVIPQGINKFNVTSKFSVLKEV